MGLMGLTFAGLTVGRLTFCIAVMPVIRSFMKDAEHLGRSRGSDVRPAHGRENVRGAGTPQTARNQRRGAVHADAEPTMATNTMDGSQRW